MGDWEKRLFYFSDMKKVTQLACPHCGKSSRPIQRLIDQRAQQGADVSFGPWRCDECWHEFSGAVCDVGVHITEVRPCKERKMLSLLRFQGVLVVVDSYCDYSDDPDWYDYLFHSHQCPTNIMHSAKEVFDEDGRDPHGLFRFIAAIPDTEEARKALDAMDIASLLALFHTDGTEAPTAWPAADGGVLPWLAEMRRQYKAKQKANTCSPLALTGKGDGE